MNVSLDTIVDGRRPRGRPERSDSLEDSRIADLRRRFLDRLAALPQSDEREPTPSDGALMATAELDEEVRTLPAHIGRFVIVDCLGAGGMGVVYSAYDEALDRCLAIKVLQYGVLEKRGRRRERLLREAQAMAKVSHPNLVTVHEVATEGEQLYVAMEFIPGPTLEQWLALTACSWREIVAVFAQIAQGLAALHEAGLVHRDVKPSNIIVGDDGRVRVLDLGLVGSDPRELDGSYESPGEWTSSLSRSEGLLTKTGERLGTPAYMSPEQFRREKLTPASDMFSLCVALYEALYGVHPFLADTFEELQDNVLGGYIAPPLGDQQVPAWLHSLVLSGLADDPMARPESMDVIVARLSSDPRQRRGRILRGVGLASIAGVLGLLAARLEVEGPTTCESGEARIAEVWDASKARAVRVQMVASGLDYAGPLAERVSASLDDYALSWAQAHRQACSDHAAGVHSTELLDARMACLDRRRQALSATTKLLARADAGIVEYAGEMIAELPRLEPCADLSTLSTDDRPSLDGVQLQASITLESQLVLSETLANAGRASEARELARDVATRAEALGLPRLEAEAWLSAARSQLHPSAAAPGCDAALERTLMVAIREGFDELVSEAMIRRLYIRGLSHGGSELAMSEFPVVEAMLERAGDDPEQRALLLNNLGAVALAAGDVERAEQAFKGALRLREDLSGADHLGLAPLLANLSLLATEPDERSALHERAIAIYDAQLGPGHPQSLDARMFAAINTVDPGAASEALEALCLELDARGAVELAGDCWYALARLRYAQGDEVGARADFGRAAAKIDEATDHRAPLLYAYLSVGQAISRHEVEELAAALSSSPPRKEWWARQHQAEQRLLLARLYSDSGAARLVQATLEQGLTELESIAAQHASDEHARLLALTQAALAEALSRAPALAREREQVLARAADMSHAAREYFSRWPAHYAARLSRLEGD